MFDRFSDEARRTVVRALVEARRLGHDYVGTEHALVALALARGAAANALASEGVTVDRARLAAADVVGRGRGVSPWDDGPYTARLRHAFELCKREAYEFGHRYIASGHLLLAVLQIGDANAVRVLVHLGVDLDTLRQKVEDSIGTERPPVAPAERRTYLSRSPTIAGPAASRSAVGAASAVSDGLAGDGMAGEDLYGEPAYDELAADELTADEDAYDKLAADELVADEDDVIGIPAASAVAAGAATQDAPDPLEDERRCSFCTRPVDDRDSYVAGAEALICAECVRAAVRLIGDGAHAPTVDGRAPDGDAVTGVTRAFTTVFDQARSDAERAALLEDGEVLAPLLAWAHEGYPEAGGARVDRVRFLDGDRALVHYAIELGPTHLPRSGWARRHPSGWKVTRETYTTLLHQAGIPPL